MVNWGGRNSALTPVVKGGYYVKYTVNVQIKVNSYMLVGPFPSEIDHYLEFLVKKKHNFWTLDLMLGSSEMFKTAWLGCHQHHQIFTYNSRGRFHEKSQTEPDSRLSQGLKSETFVSAEFLAQMDFTKGGSAETSLKLWSQLFNLISYI